MDEILDISWTTGGAYVIFETGNTPLWIGTLLTGTSSLRGRQGLPTVKRIFSKVRLGKCKQNSAWKRRR